MDIGAMTQQDTHGSRITGPGTPHQQCLAGTQAHTRISTSSHQPFYDSCVTVRAGHP
jgi:hypothetical protein